jgi:ubiquinone/menaquinone biosynthesis C-methylase UbiE
MHSDLFDPVRRYVILGNTMPDSVHQERNEYPYHERAMAPFQEDWQLYRKMVDNNFLFHREAYARLHDILKEEIDRPFRFLDIACGDASESVSALKGTKVARYDGIDISRPALELAAKALERLGCPFTLERGDFVGMLRDSDKVADVAWIGLSLHHFLTTAKVTLMQSVRRIVPAQGLFLIYEPASPDGEDRDGWLQRYARQREDWSEYAPKEWDTMWAHILAADFPETTSEWHSLGRAAGFSRVREMFVAPSNLFRMYCFSD